MFYDEAKHNSMIELFKQGRTLNEIGSIYSVTGERVRQILARHGVRGSQGGRKLVLAQRKSEILATRNQACIEKHGCSVEQFNAVCGRHSDGARSPHYAFIHQRNHARSRGIAWHLKFWDWYSIWQASGKWEYRGRGTGGHCMCRYGDMGAYEVGNVYIGTVVHNSALGRTLAHERSIARTHFYGVIHAAGGRKAVSEAICVPVNYISQLANNGQMPRCWLDDGRAQRLADMTTGAYSLSDLAVMCGAPLEKEAV